MNYLKLLVLAVGIFSLNNAFSADCGLGKYLKVYVQQADGEFKQSQVKCTKLVTNVIALEETWFSDLTYSAPFFFEVSVKESSHSPIQVFRCGSSTQAHSLKSLASKVISRIKDKKPEFEIEPESDFGVIQKISEGKSIEIYTPNNYPARIMAAYALGPLYPFEAMDLGSDCKKLE